MKIEDVPIDKIHIGLRFRKEEGDLEALAGNISDLGLLEPIGVDEYYNLIFGVRRLRACRDILEWQAIPCVVLQINSILAGEYAENEFRKQFTSSERVAIGEAIEEELTAKERRGHPQTSAIAEVSPAKGNSVDIAAKRAGFNSAETFERARIVTQKGTPDLIAAMDRKDISVSAAAAIASQPKDDQARIVAMPKDERREVVRRIRKTKADREVDEQRARDMSVFSNLYDSVQFLARFYEDPKETWNGIARVNGFDFADLLHKAIQCLVRLEKGNPNDRQPELIKKVL